MGEALISRASSFSADDIVVPIPGYHQIIATLLSNSGTPMQNMSLNCLDGSVWYNYTTNERGKVKFVTNSGSANISFSNVFPNGARCIDLESAIVNIDAPVGSVTNLNIQLNKVSQVRYNAGSNGSYVFLDTNHINLELGAGGGGGGGGWRRYSSYDNVTDTGGGGGGGEYKVLNNLLVNIGQSYPMYIGYGGSGGGAGATNGHFGGSGGTGGTTSFLGYSVVGGTGGGGGGSGKPNYSGPCGNYGVGANSGYFGNGAGYSQSAYTFVSNYNNSGTRTGFNSNVSIWGGGGASGSDYYDRFTGGYPGGGSKNSAGTNGGGGGGGEGYASGGKGGDGMVRITMID